MSQSDRGYSNFGNDSTIRSMVSSNRVFDNSHSQTTITFHPSFCSLAIFSLSRLWLYVILSFQKSVFVLGMLDFLQFSCPCQKHPFTNMAVLNLGRTISGCPYRFFTLILYLNPSLNNSFLTFISGLVLLEWMFDIQRCRCSEVIKSATELTIKLIILHEVVFAQIIQ